MDSGTPGRAVVLFLHGLESGPGGSKARALKEAGFSVVAPALPSARAYLLRDPVLPLVPLALLVLAVLPWLAQLAPVTAAAFSALSPAFGARLGYAWLVRRRQDACYAIAAEAASTLPVGATVVGSSNGGGLAVRLLTTGNWTGAAVLLCPAQDKVARWALRRMLRLRDLPPAVQAKVLVVHGDADDIVPLAHSEALVAGSGARLRVLPGGDHRLGGYATSEALAGWVAEALFEPAQLKAGWRASKLPA